MLIPALQALFDRDLTRLQDELRLYPTDDAVWALRPGIGNSAGTLTLHLIGNLKHFIGATLGHTGYVRQREVEFSTRDIARAELLASLDDTRTVVRDALTHLPLEQLEVEFPLEVLGRRLKTDAMLIHLLTHLGYHLGQVNYHRRLLAEAETA